MLRLVMPLDREKSGNFICIESGNPSRITVVLLSFTVYELFFYKAFLDISC